MHRTFFIRFHKTFSRLPSPPSHSPRRESPAISVSLSPPSLSPMSSQGHPVSGTKRLAPPFTVDNSHFDMRNVDIRSLNQRFGDRMVDANVPRLLPQHNLPPGHLRQRFSQNRFADARVQNRFSDSFDPKRARIMPGNDLRTEFRPSLPMTNLPVHNMSRAGPSGNQLTLSSLSGNGVMAATTNLVGNSSALPGRKFDSSMSTQSHSSPAHSIRSTPSTHVTTPCGNMSTISMLSPTAAIPLSRVATPPAGTPSMRGSFGQQTPQSITGILSPASTAFMSPVARKPSHAMNARDVCVDDFDDSDLANEEVENKAKQARLVLKELDDGSFDVRVAPREPRVVDLGVLMESFETKIRVQMEKSRLEKKQFSIGVVNFTGCGLDDRCVAIIMSVLSGYGLCVHTLKLSKNSISDAGFQCISEYVLNCVFKTPVQISISNVLESGFCRSHYQFINYIFSLQR